MKKITPLGKNVLIKIAETEKITASGIILPEKNNDENSQQGQVISIGDHKDIDTKIKPGVEVLFEKYEGAKIKKDKDQFIITKSKNILAILA